MIFRPFLLLGRSVSSLVHGLGARDPRQVLRHAALLLVGIWSMFLPLLLLAWFAVLSRSDFPAAVLLMSLLDSLLFVTCCFVGVRLRLRLSLAGRRRLQVVLVAVLFLSLAVLIMIQRLVVTHEAAGGLLLLAVQFYRGRLFDVYVFSLLGLVAGLNAYHDGQPGGGDRWPGALPAGEPPAPAETGYHNG